MAKAQNLFAKDITELRIGCVYLGPYKDPLDVETFYFRARLEKVYGDKVGCNVKVIVRFFGGFWQYFYGYWFFALRCSSSTTATPRC